MFVTISSHIVGCCRASWAHVVRCFMRSRAAQSSMMHIEGSTVLKIGCRLASTSCCTALYQPIPRDDVQLLEVSIPRTIHTRTRRILRSGFDRLGSELMTRYLKEEELVRLLLLYRLWNCWTWVPTGVEHLMWRTAASVKSSEQARPLNT